MLLASCPWFAEVKPITCRTGKLGIMESHQGAYKWLNALPGKSSKRRDELAKGILLFSIQGYSGMKIYIPGTSFIAGP